MCLDSEHYDSPKQQVSRCLPEIEISKIFNFKTKSLALFRLLVLFLFLFTQNSQLLKFKNVHIIVSCVQSNRKMLLKCKLQSFLTSSEMHNKREHVNETCSYNLLAPHFKPCILLFFNINEISRTLNNSIFMYAPFISIKLAFL